jgi:hypothetical protein
MDIPQDFKFLLESVAQNYNPYYENEYLIIQTYPREISLKVVNRSFDYQQAKSWCDLENFAHDYSSFALRIFHQNKLYWVNSDGTPREISKQQDWKIDLRYLNAHYDQNSEEEIVVYSDGDVICGEIAVCQCSYPYFSALVATTNRNNEPDEYWQPITCLVDDFGEIINNCPNCGTRLVDDFEDDDYFDEQEYIPKSCQGCSNYHGEVYNGNLLVCAIHPYGWEDESCPDFLD